MAEVRPKLAPTATVTITTRLAYAWRAVWTNMAGLQTPAPKSNATVWRPSCKTCSGDTPWQRSTPTINWTTERLVLVSNFNF